MKSELLRISVPTVDDGVSALLQRPARARWLLLLAHGAGAGMSHIFMEALASALAARDIATLRYQFPYMEQGIRRPDPPRRLVVTVRAAAAFATEIAGDLPFFASGKSLGGRMTSTAASEEPLPGVRGLIFFGFPLHPSGKPGTARSGHLDMVTVPMLFLQGTRDKLADLDLLRPVCAELGTDTTLHEVEGADHGFHVLKRSGRTDEEVLTELVETADRWATAQL